ncbi:hypothetical protein AGENTSMITH_91 [Bacillus phage vB_BspM_AgentSmith]|nr:hypothetical protein AGENTSMITH_91 [Bacillus phage vB_BspM_AgentSmith]
MKTKKEIKVRLTQLQVELEELKGVYDLKVVTPKLREIIKEAQICKEQADIHYYLENKNSIQLH